EEIIQLFQELDGIGLGTLESYGHFRFLPGLTSFLAAELTPEALAQARAAWFDGMVGLAGFLYQQRSKDSQLSSTLTLLELPNLLAALEQGEERLSPEGAVAFAAGLEQLLADLGRPAALARAVEARTRAAARVPAWGKARFEAERLTVKRLLAAGNLPEAHEKAQRLLRQCQTGGDYPGADHDLAMAHTLLGQVLRAAGQAGEALECQVAARRLFANLGGENGQRMASSALARQGDCLRALGRLDEAAADYEQAIVEFRELQDDRGIAAGQNQLGTVRMLQRRYPEALQAHEEARKIFTILNEPRSVASAWHQTGMVLWRAGQYAEAEKAYKASLAIRVQEKDRANEASSLNELGILFEAMGRLEDGVRCCRQAADICVALPDLAKEGRVRSNLANALIQLRRFDEARAEVMRAIACNGSFGHAVEPWKTWHILNKLEQATGNPAAATSAREKAKSAFLAYRRAGGENHEGGGRWCAMTLQAIQAGAGAQMAAALAEPATSPDVPVEAKPLIAALQKILTGARDPALAEDPALFFMDACELTLLLEALG
ncbi:MAG: tetratricopeptide repeat protein, partial [Magnetococcales bacterium]|nr:tetratricopeptide repeat protein [Magnetococcales bacterium]